MSLIRKISLALASLVTIFSLSSTVFAQELLNDSTLSTAKIDMSGFSSQPDVSIGNLVLDKTVYVAGDTIKGSFTFLNNNEESVSDVYYRITLAGDYKENTLADIFYNTVKYGPYYLLGGESKKIDFTYTLPKAIAGDGLGIQVGASLSTGFDMGWEDFRIKIEGEMNFLETLQAFISVGDDKFPLQAGPTIYETEGVYFEAELKNPTKNVIEIKPKVVIYNRASKDAISKELETEIIKISSGATEKIKYELPKFDNKAGVYVGDVEFLDTMGVKRAMDLEFRYIVQGNIATVRGLTVDRTDVRKGDDIKVNVSYSGTPFDIRGQAENLSAIYDLDIKLLSAEDKLISEYNKPLDFNKGNESSIIMKAVNGGTVFKSEITVKKAGVILAEYKSNIPRIESKDSDYFRMFWILIIAVLLIVPVAFSSIKKRNKIIVSLVLIVLGLLYPLYFAKSYWTETARTSTFVGDYPYNLSVYVNSPTGNYNPGQSYYLTGSASAINCDNQDQVQDYWYKREGGTGGTYGGTSGILENSSYPRTGQFSIGPFIAESTPGNHIIWLEVDFYPYHNGNKKTDQRSSLVGYKTYTVITPVNHTLSITKSGTGLGTVSGVGISCGSDCSDTVASGTKKIIIASSTSGSIFAGWSGGGCSGTGSCVVTMNTDRIVNADFSIINGGGDGGTCSDGIRNQDETGVDTGGICSGGDNEGDGDGSSDTCSDGIQNQNETGIDCGGVCPACVTQADPSLNCASLTASLPSPVNVNNTVIWIANPVEQCPTCVKEWAVIDSNNSTPNFIAGSNPWNKIFTTIGLKEIIYKLSTTTSTGIIRYGTCTATTTVVQEGGSSGEM